VIPLTVVDEDGSPHHEVHRCFLLARGIVPGVFRANNNARAQSITLSPVRATCIHDIAQLPCRWKKRLQRFDESRITVQEAGECYEGRLERCSKFGSCCEHKKEGNELDLTDCWLWNEVRMSRKLVYL
jgi:hypothetical protein